MKVRAVGERPGERTRGEAAPRSSGGVLAQGFSGCGGARPAPYLPRTELSLRREPQVYAVRTRRWRRHPDPRPPMGPDAQSKEHGRLRRDARWRRPRRRRVAVIDTRVTSLLRIACRLPDGGARVLQICGGHENTPTCARAGPADTWPQRRPSEKRQRVRSVYVYRPPPGAHRDPPSSSPAASRAQRTRSWGKRFDGSTVRRAPIGAPIAPHRRARISGGAPQPPQRA